MKKNHRLYLLLSFALIAVLICALLPSVGFSKYRTEFVFANQADYTNTLAESFKLLDHPMKQLEDGSYAVDNAEGAQPTAGYTFKLIPGITIPAAPYVEITGKTAIPAFLYLEVKNTSGVSLNYDSKWTRLSGVTGKKGGDVYVYDNGSALTGDDAEAVLTAPTFTVDTLSKYPDSLTEGEIKVYAYMIQKVGTQTASEAYNSAPSV